MPDKVNTLSGRLVVDAYRAAHAKLSAGGWYRGMSESHTSLLEKMQTELQAQGFNSLEEFEVASTLLNIQTLGFLDKLDLKARATKAERLTFLGMWF